MSPNVCDKESITKIKGHTYIALTQVFKKSIINQICGQMKFKTLKMDSQTMKAIYCTKISWFIWNTFKDSVTTVSGGHLDPHLDFKIMPRPEYAYTNLILHLDSL